MCCVLAVVTMTVFFRRSVAGLTPGKPFSSGWSKSGGDEPRVSEGQVHAAPQGPEQAVLQVSVCKPVPLLLRL